MIELHPINYAQHLWYVLIRIQQEEVEALESSEEGDASQPSPSHPSLFLFCANPDSYLVPHTYRVV